MTEDPEELITRKRTNRDGMLKSSSKSPSALLRNSDEPTMAFELKTGIFTMGSRALDVVAGHAKALQQSLCLLDGFTGKLWACGHRSEVVNIFCTSYIMCVNVMTVTNLAAKSDRMPAIEERGAAAGVCGAGGALDNLLTKVKCPRPPHGQNDQLRAGPLTECGSFGF